MCKTVGGTGASVGLFAYEPCKDTEKILKDITEFKMYDIKISKIRLPVI